RHEGGRANLVVSGGRSQGAHLVVTDSAGRVKSLLLVNPESVGLYLSPVDASGPPRSPRVVFEVLNQGTGGFAFYDRNGQSRAQLGSVSDDGSTQVMVLDASGKAFWKAPGSLAGRPGRGVGSLLTSGAATVGRFCGLCSLPGLA